MEVKRQYHFCSIFFSQLRGSRHKNNNRGLIISLSMKKYTIGDILEVNLASFIQYLKSWNNGLSHRISKVDLPMKKVGTGKIEVGIMFEKVWKYING